ncbi:hypothetical protein [Streptomyces sp. NPDC088350]|uniref:hypothetical protein n=1 Tax=Streptomyces sp. NPDC088350 TaxID=3365854 RepID=UPI003805D6F0
MVKPPYGGSSMGMSVVREQADLPQALADAAGEEGDAVLVEDCLTGVSLTVGLLELPGDAVVVLSPLATEATEAEFYDADTKLDVDTAASASAGHERDESVTAWWSPAASSTAATARPAERAGVPVAVRSGTRWPGISGPS